MISIYAKLVYAYIEKDNLSSIWGNKVEPVANDGDVQVVRLRLGPFDTNCYILT